MGGGGSSGGGGTTQSVSNQYSSLSPWAAPYVTSMLGAAQNQVFQSTPTAAIPGTPAGNYDAQGNPVQGGGYDAQGNPAPGTPGTPASTQITGMNPYNAFGTSNGQGGQYGMTANDMTAANSAVAPFSQLQNQSFQGAGNLQTPGQFGQATNLAGTAGMGALGTTGQASMYGGMGAMAGQQGAQQSNMYGGLGALAGQQYAGLSGAQGQQGNNIGQSLGQMSTNPNAVGAYMNPYLQQSLAPQLQLANQQYGMAGQQMASQATGQGAFGGSRNALQQSLNAQNQMLAQNQIIGQGYNTAFTNAQNQMNAANQAALAGNQQALTGYNQAGSQSLQGLNMGLTGASQAGNLGIAGAQSGLSGIGAQQAGYGLAGTQGTNLANIGTGQLGAQQSILGTQNQYGQQQTAGQQAIINQAMQNYQTGQNYPMTQLTNLKNLASGIPVTDTTQVQQVAPPSTANLIGGAGMTGLGIAAASGNAPTTTINMMQPQATAAKAGGIMKIKRMANGGIGSIVTKAIDDPKSVPDQSLKDGVIPKGLPADLVSALKTSESLQSKAISPAPTSTVVQDNDAKLQQQVAQTQAVDLQKLQAALPTILADLKVQRDIAEEKGNKKEVKQIDMMMSEILAKAQEGQAQQMQPQSIQQLSQPQQAPQGIQQLAQPQQAPQQMAQAPQQVPQGIAGGGVIAFRKGGEVKRFFEGGTGSSEDDIYVPPEAIARNKASGEGLFSGISKALNDQQNAYIQGTMKEGQNYAGYKPPVTPAPTAPTPDSLGRTPVTPIEESKNKPNNKIIIGDRAPSVPREPSAPVVNMDTFDVTKSTNNITKMVDNFSNMLMSQYNRDDSSKAISNALIAGGAAWGSHKGVGTGMGDAIGAFGPEYLRSTQAENDRKDKLMGQYMALGMSGAGLQMQAQKLGIDASEVPSKIKMQEAAAWKYTHPTAGAGAGAPKGIAGNVSDKILDKYEGYMSSPRDATFYSSNLTIPLANGRPLTWGPEDRKYLESAPKTKAGQDALNKWQQVVEAKKNERLGQIYNLGGRNTAPAVYSDE